jgi:hypothetical protein
VEPIQLTKATPEFSDQLSFLISLEFKAVYKKHIKTVYYFLSWTVFFVLLWTLTDGNDFVTLKAVLTVLTILIWSAAIIFILTVLFRYYKRISWRNNAVKDAFNNKIQFKFSFDGERIYYASNDQRWDLSWSYYKYWCEKEDSVYIFKESNIYEALYYSKFELGLDIYNQLKEIASDRLISLDKKTALNRAV